MLQFYFLSVSTLLMAGLSLLFSGSEESTHSFRRFISSRTVKISLGAVAVLVGVIKIFVRAPFDTIVVAGDLLPAIAGMALGLALLGDALIGRTAEQEKLKKIQSASRFYRVPLGIVGIAAGLAHFFVPGAVIL